jgi:gliding motility-associated-like protein
MKKKIYYLGFLISFLLFLNSFSFGQISHWMEGAGGVSIDEGVDISTDASGNTYTTGYFSGTATFGSTVLTSHGITDIFVTKTNSAGVFQWVVNAGGPGPNRGLSIKADAAGNSYITGFYYGTAYFGSTTITSNGLQDVFIAKYNTSGVLQWVTSAGGTESDIGNGINVDNLGNVLVTGEFKGTATFGSTTLTSMNNSVDVFAAKLDPSGNFLWTKQGAAPLIDRGIDIASDASGNVYVTGMFADTITFDITHFNTIHNAIFIVKYNSSGAEQWFQKIGGGTLNVVSGIAIDATNNIYVTGDFGGNLIFFGSPNTTITNTYANRIFIAKYDSGGSVLWAKSDGSDGEIISKNIALDATGVPYMIGNFKCKLSDYADHYGQGTFNSIGFTDIFVTKYSTNGIWQWSRQYGSTMDDNAGGIALNNNGQAIITGSFSKSFMFPQTTNLLGYSVYPVYYSGMNYCGDLNYGACDYYASVSNSTDILISNIVDPAIPTYDYYARTGTGCSKPYEGVCIADYYTSTCVDTLTFCGFGYIYANSKITTAGPTVSYLWSNGGTDQYTQVSSSGYYSVTQTSADGCFVSSDSIYVTIHPNPPIPTISDNVGINTNATYTNTIELCGGNVTLTGGNFGSNLNWWAGSPATTNTNVFTVNTSGVYYFNESTVFGCVSSNSVNVIFHNSFSDIIPEMVCIEDTDKNDTITLCQGQIFSMFVYDSITNPLGNSSINISPIPTIYWSVVPSNTISFSQPTVGCYNNFAPSQSGLYQITAMVVRVNVCDADTVYVTQSIYVKILPSPTISITGSQYICPGDSTLLVASGADNYSWGVSMADSLWIHQEGGYSVSGTNSFGCSSGSYYYVSYYPLPPQPVVTMNPSNGLICPNDSVQLFCNGSGTFLWEGPSGPFGGNSSSVFVSLPGFYYCVKTDTNQCGVSMISNTVIINQYGTPYLLASQGATLCPGGSVQLSVISNDTSNIQWQAPLSGNSSVQNITVAGTYTCSILSCGIVTSTSSTVTMSDVSATISPTGPLNFCVGDSVVLNANFGMVNYQWLPGNTSQPTLTVFQPGTYQLNTTDGNGCIATSTPVIVNTSPSPTINVNSSTICQGALVTLTANGGNSYQWSTGDNTANINVSPSTTSTYTVTGTTLGCSGTSIATVNVNPLPTILANSPAICSGKTTTIKATGATSYVWSTGATIDSIIVAPIVNTTYTVTGTLLGCSNSAVVNITANPTPVIVVNSPIVCEGQSATIVASGAGTYVWSNGNQTNSLTVSPTNTTMYKVIGTTNNCSDSVTSTVTIIPNTLTPPIAKNIKVCYAESAILDVVSNATVQWYSSDTSSTPIYTGTTYTTPNLTTNTTYYISSEDQYCKSTTTHVVVIIDNCDSIIAPTIFTPNGDGINDLFHFDVQPLRCFHCKIYNRWGKLVYEWDDATGGWDGKIMNTGGLASDGVYYYILDYCTIDKGTKEIVGFMQLLRQ